MRIIAKKTLLGYLQQEKYKNAKESISSCYVEVEKENWNNNIELKNKFTSASIITSKRVVFNIKGNDYRLVVDIEYRLKLVFIVWFGSHKEYDKVDIKGLVFKREAK